MAPLVLIQVAPEQFDAAARFYARAFGLVVGRRLGPDALELLGAQAPVHLVVRPAAGRDAASPAPVELDLVVDDLEAARARALAAGARSEGGVRDYAWGSIAQLVDPFGNRICLLAFRRDGRRGGLAEPAAPWRGPRGEDREGRTPWPQAC